MVVEEVKYMKLDIDVEVVLISIACGVGGSGIEA